MIEIIELYRKFIERVRIYISNDLRSWKELSPKNSLEGSSINAYIALYEDGQIIDGQNVFEPLPDGAYFIEARSNIDQSKLPCFKELEFNSDHLKIIHLDSPFKKFQTDVYMTKITNISNKSVKINKFSAYKIGMLNRFKKRPSHSTIINGWFNNTDFKLWYGLKSDILLPGESVCDCRNYGKNCIWVYEVQMDDGKLIWIGSKKE